MKNINEMSTYLQNKSSLIVQNLIKAQQHSAGVMYADVIENANVKTGAFISSIKQSPTTYSDGEIKTKVTSNLQVVSKSGKSYNLAFLLEKGTSPHAIPNAFNWGEIYGYDSVRYKMTLSPNWHPGTIAYNTFYNAVTKYRPYYKEQISKAIREALK